MIWAVLCGLGVIQSGGVMQAKEAEALSLKEALLWARRWTSSKCIFETDAKVLVDAIHGNAWECRKFFF